MQAWELHAREEIRDSIARYNWAGDAGRLDELAATFCDDGVLEVRGFAPVTGRSAIVDFLGGVTEDGARTAGGKPIVRHNVANTLFRVLEPARAEVWSYFTVFSQVGLDHLGRYRDVFVPVADRWLIRQRSVSTDWMAPDSVFAR